MLSLNVNFCTLELVLQQSSEIDDSLCDLTNILTTRAVARELARIEAQEVISAMLRRFTNIELACEPDSLQWRADLALRGLRELPVKLS